MNIDRLLEYQAIDSEILKIDLEFRALPIYREYHFSINSYRDAQAAVKRLNGEAENLHKQMVNAIEQYANLNKQISDAEKELDDIDDINQADFYSRNIEKTLSELQQLSKSISELSIKIDEHRQSYDKALKQGREAKLKGTEAKPVYDKALLDVKPKIDELKSKMMGLEKDLENKAVNQYKQLRSAKRFPAIVKLHGESSCGGCFMELAGNSVEILKSKGYIECPNCSRLIYIK